MRKSLVRVAGGGGGGFDVKNDRLRWAALKLSIFSQSQARLQVKNAAKG